VVLADEPCASLDPKTARAVLGEFLALCREQRKTLLVVSHAEQALRGADQVLDMAALNRTVGTSS
jgi:phosphonate transport system ATP-binding protein